MLADGKLDFGGPASQRAGDETSAIFGDQTYFRQSFGFIIYGIPNKFLNFSCLSVLTSNEDNNTSVLRERKLFKHGAGPTNCHLKLLQQGKAGYISGCFCSGHCSPPIIW